MDTQDKPTEKKASDHLYRALAELQQAEGKMQRSGHTPPILLAGVRQAKDLISSILN